MPERIVYFLYYSARVTEMKFSHVVLFFIVITAKVESLEEYMARDAFCGFGELSLVYLLFSSSIRLQRAQALHPIECADCS